MRILGLGAALWLGASSLRAQETSSHSKVVSPLRLLGSVSEDRARITQLQGGGGSPEWLVRTPSRMTRPDSAGVAFTIPGACRLVAAAVPEAAAVSWNSQLPFARNDAGVWAGRGMTVMGGGGVRLNCGRVTLYAVPEVWHAQNQSYYVLPSGNPTRSDFASPFHSIAQSSADLPLRLGTRPVTAIQPGQSSITVDAGHVAVGFGTEGEWWGPGIRNALVLSNNAAGIPRWFVGTARPIRTSAGQLTARLISGTLTESRYFERFERNVLRPLSGVVLTFTPAVDSNLTIGAARVVYRRRTASTLLPMYAFDALTYWSVRSPTDSADQLSELFGRWVFPTAGFEFYGEWARSVLPSSFQDFLVAPQEGQGYTVGMQWLSGAGPTPTLARANWRVQLELTDLEQVRPSRTESPPSFYTSPVVPQGYTQRGRVIGASIGPGAQSQWLALDRVSQSALTGVFLGRIRWEHDEFFPQPTGLSFYAHDVSLYGGLRGSWQRGMLEYSGELQYEKRMNYLFQHGNHGFGNDRTFDVDNISVRIVLAPSR